MKGIQLAPLVTDLKIDIKSFKTDMGRITTEAIGEAKKISSEMAKVSKVGETMSSVGSSATKYATVPLLGAAAAATKFSKEFGDSAAKVSTIADTTKVPIDQLKSGIIDLSNKTGLAASDLNEALYQTISAGVDTGEAVEFLGTATKAAKGGFTDTATAVDGLTTVLNSYGLETKDAEKIANQMLVTQNKGKTTFGELAASMGQVTPVAANLGVKTEELLSSLAATTAQGLGTSESITALKAAMSNIIKPSKEASEAAESLGIDFSVSALQSKGWIGFLNDVKDGLQSACPEFDKISCKFGENAMKMLQLEKAGKKNTEEYKKLNKEQKDLNKELELLGQAADSQIGGFATLFGSVEGLNSMLMLTSDQGMSIYNDTMQEMETNTTALRDAYDKMDQAPGTEMQKAFNDIKNIGIEVGDILMPVIRDVLEDVRGLAKGFRDLSPETKETIVKVAGLAAAFGPLLNVTGNAISTFAKLKPVVGGVGKAFKEGIPAVSKFLGKLGATKGVGAAASTALGSVTSSAAAAGGAAGLGGVAASLGSAALAAAPFVAAGAAVVGTGYLIHKQMSKEVIPTVDLFADKVEYTSGAVGKGYSSMAAGVEVNTVKISEATESAVQAYIDMDDKVTNSLYEQKVHQEVVTEEMSQSMIDQFNSMGESIKNSQQEKFQEMSGDLTNFFTENSTLTEEREAEILQTVSTKHQERQEVVDNAMKRITEIYTSAKDRNEALTKEELDEVAKLQEQMRNNAIDTMSETEQEAAVIKERMKDYQGRLTAEMASDMITKANETRDKEIDAATEKYEGVVKQASRLKEAGLITDEEYNNMVNKAKETRDEQINKAREASEGIRKEIEDATPGISKQVELQTGKIKTWYNRAWDSISGFFGELFSSNERAINEASQVGASARSGYNGSHYNGLNYVPFDGYMAKLHKGERVLTAEENKGYNQGNQPGVTPGQILTVIQLDKEEIGRAVTPIVSNQIAMEGMMTR